MIDQVDDLGTRRLQQECARVLAAEGGFGNHDLVKFNNLAHHDSHAWYRAVIRWYVEQHGDLPSAVGPGAKVRLILGEDE